MNFNFILAEEVRGELGGKQTVLGLFPDRVVILSPPKTSEQIQPENQVIGIERLAFLINISELPEGQHRFKGKIITPEGKSQLEDFPLGEASVEHGLSHTIVLEAKPFVVSVPGIYKFELYVDDAHAQTFEFEMRLNDVVA